MLPFAVCRVLYTMVSFTLQLVMHIYNGGISNTALYSYL